MADSAVQLEDLPLDARVALPHDHPLLNNYASRMESQYGLPTGFMNALKNAGERSNSNQVSPKGAQGVMQVMPGTQKQLGITNPLDPLQSIQGAAQYSAQNATSLGTSDPAALAAAYHAGPASKAARGDFSGSPITKKYADAVSAAMPIGSAQAAGPVAGGVDPQDVPSGAPAPAQWDPHKDMSNTDLALAGVGKFFADTGSGLRQLAATAVNPVARYLTKNAAHPDGVDALDPDYAGEKARATEDAPLMNTAAGLGGNIGANMLGLALPGGMAARLATRAVEALGATRMGLAVPAVARAAATYGPGALSSGALSALTPTTADGERTTNMELGAALSPALQGLGNGAAAVGRAGYSWLSRNAPGAASALDSAGSALTSLGPLLRKSFNATATPTDQQSVARAVMNDIPVYPQQLDKPGTTALSRGQVQGQQSAFSRALNSSMGQTTDDIPGAIASAHDAIGDTYGRILDNASIPLDQSLAQKAATIHGQYLYNNVAGAPDSGLEDAVTRLVDLTTQGRTLTGRQYQDMLRDYSAGANRAQVTSLNKGMVTNTPDINAANAYRDLAGAVTDHATQYLPPNGAADFQQANRQWRNMRMLQSVAPVSNGVEDYSPQTVARMLKQRDPNSFFFDQGDPLMSDLAKFGTKYMGLDANAPTSWGQRAKTSIMNNAPVLAGDAIGGMLAGDAMSSAGDHGPDQPSAASRLLKGTAAALLTHGALSSASRSLNPRIGLDYLNSNRGALAEAWRRAQLAPAVQAGLASQRDGQPTPSGAP